jgi:hypothetical protein
VHGDLGRPRFGRAGIVQHHGDTIAWTDVRHAREDSVHHPACLERRENHSGDLGHGVQGAELPAKPLRHAVEGVPQLLEFVPARDLDPTVEALLGNPPGPRL